MISLSDSHNKMCLNCAFFLFSGEPDASKDSSNNSSNNNSTSNITSSQMTSHQRTSSLASRSSLQEGVATSVAYASASGSSSSNSQITRPRLQERPFFDDISPHNVTSLVGQSALLKCRVKHVGDRTVSRFISNVSLIKMLFQIWIPSYIII